MFRMFLIAAGLLAVAASATAQQPRVKTVTTKADIVASFGGGGRAWDAVRAVAYSPDGKRFAAASDDGQIQLTDVATGKPLRTLTGGGRGNQNPQTTNSYFGLVFGPDGQWLAAASGDNSLKVWDLTKEEAPTILKDHTNGIFSLSATADRRTLATASDDRTVRVWDVAAGKSTFTLPSQGYYLSSVAISPDGALLAVGAWNQTVTLWRSPAASNSPSCTVTRAASRRSPSAPTADNWPPATPAASCGSGTSHSRRKSWS